MFWTIWEYPKVFEGKKIEKCFGPFGNTLNFVKGKLIPGTSQGSSLGPM
jgi:hypothetical protein